MERAAAPGLAGRITLHLAERLVRLESAAARVRAGDDDDAIHDLRVAARRLEGGLRLWRGLLADGPRRRARRRLRSLRRALGPAREREAEVAGVRDALERLPREGRVAAEHLMIRLTRRLERERAKARRGVSAGAVDRVRRAVERAAERLPETAAAAPEALEGAVATVKAARAAARAALSKALESGGDERLHGARIGLKRLRYALETLAAGTAEAPWKQAADTARDLQHALGHAHDAALLRALVDRRVRRLRERGAEASAAALLPLLARVEARRDEAVAAARDLAPRLDPAARPGPGRLASTP